MCSRHRHRRGRLCFVQGYAIHQILLVSPDLTLHPLIGQAVQLLEANLLVAATPHEAMQLPADLVLWHTVMNFDKRLYARLQAHCHRVIVLCSRPAREWIGRGEPIKVPYIIVPTDPEEICTIIRAMFDRYPAE